MQAPENGQYHMGGRYEIDVQGSFLLQAGHLGRQVLIRSDAALTQPADLVVLAEEAFEVASGEEDRPRPAPGPALQPILDPEITPSAEHGFLAEMKQGGGNSGLMAALTDSFFPGLSVDVTVVRTESASAFLGGKVLQSRFDRVDLGFGIHNVFLESFYHDLRWKIFAIIFLTGPAAYHHNPIPAIFGGRRDMEQTWP